MVQLNPSSLYHFHDLQSQVSDLANMDLGFIFGKMGIIPISLCLCTDWIIWHKQKGLEKCLILSTKKESSMSQSKKGKILFLLINHWKRAKTKPFPSPGDLASPGIEPASLVSPVMQAYSISAKPLRNPSYWSNQLQYRKCDPKILQISIIYPHKNYYLY